MAIRPILTAGEPVLRQKAKKVTSFGPSLEGLVEDMLDSMHAVNGLGLAAPQIGIHESMPAGDGLVSYRRDKFGGGFGEDHIDFGASLG